MNQSSTKTVTFVTLLSLVVSLLQYLACCFIDSSTIIIIGSIFVFSIASVLLVHQTQDFEVCFSFQLICIFVQLLTTITTYNHTQSNLPNFTFLVLLCIVNWLVPSVICFVLYLIDRASHYKQYTIFFRNSAILFFLAYFAFFGYALFWNNDAYHYYNFETAVFSWIPFATIAENIQNCVVGTTSIFDLLLYLLGHIIMYVPYGFLLSLLLRPLPLVVRLCSLIVLPIVTEVVQFIFRLGPSDMDDIILGFLGAGIGMFGFFVCNILCKQITGRVFLQKNNRRNYYQSSIR